MDGQTPNLHIFRCLTGLRGYHVYQVDWNPIFGQEIVFNQENNNNIHDSLGLEIFFFIYLKIFSPNSR